MSVRERGRELAPSVYEYCVPRLETVGLEPAAAMPSFGVHGGIHARSTTVCAWPRRGPADLNREPRIRSRDRLPPPWPVGFGVGAQDLTPEQVCVWRRVGIHLMRLGKLDALIGLHAGGVSFVGDGLGDRASVEEVMGAIVATTTVRELSLAYNAIGDAGATALAEALRQSPLHALTALDLSNNKVGTAGADVLAAMLPTQGLTSLDLSGNQLGAGGFRRLAAWLRVASTLTQLRLRDTGLEHDDQDRFLGHALLRALARHPTSLRILDLSQNNISEDWDETGSAPGVVDLARMLRANSTLTDLDLSNDGLCLTGDLAGAIAANSTLTALRMSSNWLLGRPLSQVLVQNRTLTTLHLRDCGYGDSDEETHLLAGALAHNTSLTELDLGKNDFNDNGAMELVEAAGPHLRINLADNVHVSRALGEALERNSGGRLEMDSNLATYGCAHHLSLSLVVGGTAFTLTRLRLSHTRLTQQGFAALAGLIKANTVLTEIWLQELAMQDAEAEVLAGAIVGKTSLTLLDVSGNRVSSDAASQLALALSSLTRLTNLSVANNPIGAAGARAIIDALRESSGSVSHRLDLRGILDRNEETNNILDRNVLFEALRGNTTITQLDLAGNRLYNADVQSLADALEGNTTLTTLELGRNFSIDRVEAVARIVRDCALTLLGLQSTTINASGRDTLFEALGQNTTLTILDLTTTTCVYIHDHRSDTGVWARLTLSSRARNV